MPASPKQLPVVTVLLGLFLVTSGCLKTRIMTQQQSSPQHAEIAWAHGFVYGLVPPVNGPLEAEGTCGSAGVSDVYFRQTFVQVLAQGLTGSLYSPQTFTATCAAGGMSVGPTPPPYLLKKNSDLRISDLFPSSATTASNQNRRP